MAEQPCVHHWELPPGLVVTGTCRKCGTTRIFTGGLNEKDLPAWARDRRS